MTDEDDDNQAGYSPRQGKFIHVDMDAFYASVEQRDNSALPASRPLSADPAKGASRLEGRRIPRRFENRKDNYDLALATTHAA